MTQGVEMLPVDWSRPVEAVRDDGLVAGVTDRGLDTDDSGDHVVTIHHPDAKYTVFHVDGSPYVESCQWRIRNVVSHTHPAATGSVREAAVHAERAKVVATEHGIDFWALAEQPEIIAAMLDYADERVAAAAPTPDAAASSQRDGNQDGCLAEITAWIDAEAPSLEPPSQPTVGFPPSRDPEHDDGNDVVREAFEEGISRGLWLAADKIRQAGGVRFQCAAIKQGTAGGNDPASCGYPECGCDPDYVETNHG